MVVELQGSVFFGTTDQLFQSIEADVKKAQFLVLDFHRVQSLDATAGHMIERIQQIIKDRNATLILSRLPSRLPNGRNLKAYIDHIGLHRGNNTKSFEELADAREWVEDEIIRLHKLDLSSSHTLTPADFDLFSDLTQQEAKQLNQAVHRLHFKKSELSPARHPLEAQGPPYRTVRGAALVRFAVLKLVYGYSIYFKVG